MLGYLKKDGKIISKFDLPGTKEDHELPGDVEFIEVATRAELESVEVYEEPESERSRTEQLITNKIRAMALAELKKEGKVRPDYEL